MKKTLFLSIILMALFITACNSTPKSNGTTAVAAEKKPDCLTGTWGHIENNNEMTFTFNEDKSGKEVYSADDIRSFSWTMKDGNPAIVYDGETNEWQFTLDCEKQELQIMGIIYKKK